VGIFSVTGAIVEMTVEALDDVWTEGMLAAIALDEAAASTMSAQTLVIVTRTTRLPIRILEGRNLGL